MIRRFFLLPSLLLLFSDGTVLACMVCGTANPQARYAFFWTAALMTVIPLAMIGGFGYFLARKARARDQSGP